MVGLGLGRRKFSSDPQTMQEAMNRSDWSLWQQAMESEFGSIEKNDSWDEVTQADIPTHEKIVRSRFVFSISLQSLCFSCSILG